MVRVGVIGTGFGASTVAPAFEAADDCTVVEVVTPRDEAAVAALCARNDVDLVSVHSPPFLHLAHVRRAIDAGHAVLCDKPFGLDADEAAVMTDLAKEAGIVNLLNFERRFDPGPSDCGRSSTTGRSARRTTSSTRGFSRYRGVPIRGSAARSSVAAGSRGRGLT